MYIESSSLLHNAHSLQFRTKPGEPVQMWGMFGKELRPSSTKSGRPSTSTPIPSTDMKQEMKQENYTFSEVQGITNIIEDSLNVCHSLFGPELAKLSK